MRIDRLWASAALVAAAACIAYPRPAAAQAVTELTVSGSETGEAQDLFGEATQSVWVRFGYRDASFTTLEMTLQSPAGVLMFSREAEFNGTGSEAWEVTGDEVARGLADQAAQNALTAQESAQRAATQQFGVVEYLASAAYTIRQTQSTATLLGHLPLDEGTSGALLETVAAARDMLSLLVQAQNLPPGDVGGRRLLAAQMSAPAGRAVAASAALSAGINATEKLPLPPTRSGTAENDAHTVAIRVNGSAAKTRSIWFFDGRIYLPAVQAAHR